MYKKKIIIKENNKYIKIFISILINTFDQKNFFLNYINFFYFCCITILKYYKKSHIYICLVNFHQNIPSLQKYL